MREMKSITGAAYRIELLFWIILCNTALKWKVETEWDTEIDFMWYSINRSHHAKFTFRDLNLLNHTQMEKVDMEGNFTLFLWKEQLLRPR